MAINPRDRLTAICTALPEVTTDGHGNHLAFRVATKNFCWYLDDHHGDGRVSIVVRVARDENHALVASDPERFGLPAYVARFGWVSYFIDRRPPDWDEVTELVTDSYRIQAPKRLVRGLDSSPS